MPIAGRASHSLRRKPHQYSYYTDKVREAIAIQHRCNLGGSDDREYIVG
ncbi:hypothetical protein [Limnospira platensis]|nr:hypothetical protein APLC1_6361 [Arthrospira platensis C1]